MDRNRVAWKRTLRGFTREFGGVILRLASTSDPISDSQVALRAFGKKQYLYRVPRYTALLPTEIIQTIPAWKTAQGGRGAPKALSRFPRPSEIDVQPPEWLKIERADLCALVDDARRAATGKAVDLSGWMPALHEEVREATLAAARATMIAIELALTEPGMDEQVRGIFSPRRRTVERWAKSPDPETLKRRIRQGIKRDPRFWTRATAQLIETVPAIVGMMTVIEGGEYADAVAAGEEALQVAGEFPWERIEGLPGGSAERCFACGAAAAGGAQTTHYGLTISACDEACARRAAETFRFRPRV